MEIAYNLTLHSKLPMLKDGHGRGLAPVKATNATANEFRKFTAKKDQGYPEIPIGGLVARASVQWRRKAKTWELY
ncbi:hypothetical protein FVEG_17641 [Fusarium verticillioides 7600]|uniref:Uncharacterized protein n=1 Tax=Gibberella moniliformis (strain M3125 / FGSC 7600) TaxID=334819 RepID=A0A139YBA2_GIBM7|nr:hypothetical protein FVEG_17641 [Fusarium verticillioides 7600]KYG13600.1 hypothetical protein FVEG_17641 [Fusarium verticillioides 7600]